MIFSRKAKQLVLTLFAHLITTASDNNGKAFKLVTDNRAVQLIFNNTAAKPPARIERWALRLTQFDFHIEHRPGASNIADFYSRHPDKSVSLTALVEEQETERYINQIVSCAIPPALTRTELATATAEDLELQLLTSWIGQRHGKKLPQELVAYSKIKDQLSVASDGIVLRDQRVVVPKQLQRRTVDLAHSGHQGIVKTKSLIRSRVWFVGIDAMVEKRVSECQTCQASAKKEVFEPLRPSPMPDGPWEHVDGDFFGPLKDGTYWLVNYDEYSRWVSVEKIKSVAYDDVEPVLIRLFETYGTPRVYKTDNGAPFQSHRFEAFAKRLGFVHRRITPLWPRANGEVERFMRNLGEVIRTAKLTGASRERALADFLKVYRETPHTTTKVAPSMLMMGHCHSTGIPGKPFDPKKVAEAHAAARANDHAAKAAMKREFDARMKAREPQIRLGDQVLLKLRRLDKTTPQWDPVPLTVVAVKGSMVTASRPNLMTSRNSSFFKRVTRDPLLQDDDLLNQNSDQTPKVTIACQDPETTPEQSTIEQSTIEQPTIEHQQPVETVNTGGPDPVEQPRAPDAVPEPAKQRGRPTNEQSAANAQAREAAYQLRLLENPPTRFSARIQAKTTASLQNGGEM